MFPILYQRAGFVVWSYPALLYCGVTCGVVAGNAAAHALGSDAFAVFMSTLLLIAPAIASARPSTWLVTGEIIAANRRGSGIGRKAGLACLADSRLCCFCRCR